MDLDQKFMKKCFELALKGLGKASPNPLVGCVIVVNEEIVSEGFHQQYGQAHAEVNALAPFDLAPIGATLYCNLEPCCHRNKQTPPCCDLIIKMGIQRVVISNLDPNPEVAGKGVKILQHAGVEVTTGVLKEQGEQLNEVFFKYIVSKRPFVHLKWAQSLDGFLANANGESKWISDEDARREVHYLRAKYDAIAVGKKTILVDNPKLNVRFGYEKYKACPYRTILGQVDKKEQFQVFTDEFKDKTSEYPNCDLANLLKTLGAKNISSVLVEGGASILKDFIKEGLWDKISIYIGPKKLLNGPFVLNQPNPNLMLDINHDFFCGLPKTTRRVLNNQVVIETYKN